MAIWNQKEAGVAGSGERASRLTAGTAFPAVPVSAASGACRAPRDEAGPLAEDDAWAFTQEAWLPTDDELWELMPDPEGDPDHEGDPVDAPGRRFAEAASDEPPGDEPAEARQAPDVLTGLLPRHLGSGVGFDAGGMVDQVPPGMVLAGLAEDAWAGGLGRLSDDELAGLMLAWRRLSSWATAGEMSAVAELDRRRNAQVAAGADPHLAEHVADELALVLRLTGRAAAGLLDFATALARLPLTRAALARGEIDRARAYVITDELAGLAGPHAARVEAAIIGRAAQQTTGQLRAATRRAVLAADAGAARRRQEKAREDARVEVWSEPSGTASMAGRDLPAADVLSADRRISALARRLKTTGYEGTLDQLRAAVYTALLLGRPLPDAAPPSTGPSGQATRSGSAAGPVTRSQSGPVTRSQSGPVTRSQSGPVTPSQSGADAGSAGGVGPACTGLADHAPPRAAGPAGRTGAPGLGGSVNLTMPLSAWLGASAEPGEVPGFGPLAAGDARAMAALLADRPGARWCLTLTDQAGRAVAHGCAAGSAAPSQAAPSRAAPSRATSTSATSTPATSTTAAASTRAGPARAGPAPPRDTPAPGGSALWALTVTIRPLAVGGCDHERAGPGYRPSASLRHVIEIRQRTCVFPSCRRPASRCDQDHTIPYGQGGRTCECGLAPLCRRHHRAKQAQGWRLDQPEPGVLVWRAPHGRSYRVEPDPYPGQ